MVSSGASGKQAIWEFEDFLRIGSKDSPSPHLHHPRIQGFKGKTEKSKTIASGENGVVGHLDP
jgi:hypothetical protein